VKIVLDFVIQVRRARSSCKAFQVVQTRQGNENPSFDDRSANRQCAARSGVRNLAHFIDRIARHGRRVYVNSDLLPVADSNGFDPVGPRRAGTVFLD